MNESDIWNNGLHPIDVLLASGAGQLPPNERPYILPAYSTAFLLAPMFFKVPIELASLKIIKGWDQYETENFYIKHPNATLLKIVERFCGQCIDPHSRSRRGLISRLSELHKSSRLKVFNLSPALSTQVLMGFNGAQTFYGAATTAPAISFVNAAQPLPLPENQPRPGNIPSPKPPAGGGKVIQFPKKIYGTHGNKPPPQLKVGKGFLGKVIKRSPWLLMFVPTDMGIVTEWHDPDNPKIRYVHIADMIFNFQIFENDKHLATYSIRGQYIHGQDQYQPIGDIIYDQQGNPVATVNLDGSVHEINDLTEAERERHRLSQQFWQRVLYDTYKANRGRKSFEDWLAHGAHTTPTPDEDLEYQEYLANGGQLEHPEWLAAGKPSNKPVRVVPEGDQYDAAKQREINTLRDRPKPSPEQAENLKSLTRDEYDALKAEGVSNNQIGPALSVAQDLKTGRISPVFRNDPNGNIPENLNDVLAEKLANASDDVLAFERTKGIASHSEVYAVNDLLNARPDAKMSDFAVFTQEVKKASLRGEFKPACVQCNYLLDGVQYVK